VQYEWAYERWCAIEQEICDEVEKSLLYGPGHEVTDAPRQLQYPFVARRRWRKGNPSVSYWQKSPRTRMEQIDLVVPAEDDRLIEKVEQALLGDPTNEVIESIARSLKLPKELITGSNYSLALVGVAYLRREQERQRIAYQKLITDLSAARRMEVRELERQALPIEICPAPRVVMGLDVASGTGEYVVSDPEFVGAFHLREDIPIDPVQIPSYILEYIWQK
jgi:hypothetical protein